MSLSEPRKGAIVKAIKVIGLAAASIVAMPALGTDGFDIGKIEFERGCATCHGLDGKGKGPVAQDLRLSVPDITTLAKRNGGVFPMAHVYNVIDGREEVGAHGTRVMPIWGTRYSAGATPAYDEYAFDPEAAVRGRILALIDYLYRLQSK
jgi:mono/diheme cytochrome c family protein